MTSSMADPPCGPRLAAADEPIVGAASADAVARVRRVVEDHYEFVWRTLQHLGLDDATAEDGAQQVMCVLAKRIESNRPRG